MTADTTARPARMGLLLLIIAFVAFISLGLPDGLLGVAWPSASTDFSVDLSLLSVALVAGTLGYMTSTVLTGKLVALLGIGRLLALSSFLTASALIGYTIVPSFWLMLPLVTVAGFGGGAIDAGINTYIAQHHRKMLYLLHGMFGIGTTLGPLIMTASLNVATWRWGYWLVGAFQLGMAALFFFTASMWQADDVIDSVDGSAAPAKQASLRETAALPAVWLSVALFALYAGLEVSVGQWSFSIFAEGRAVDANLAGLFVGAYWGAFTVGRLLGGFIVARVPERRYIEVSIIAAIAGALLMWWNPAPWVGLLGLPLTGFAFAPIFPALVGTTEARVGKRHMANTIGFQIGAAGLGVALLPGLSGIVVEFIGVEAITVVHLVGTALLLLVYERAEPRT